MRLANLVLVGVAGYLVWQTWPHPAAASDVPRGTPPAEPNAAGPTGGGYAPPSNPEPAPPGLTGQDWLNAVLYPGVRPLVFTDLAGAPVELRDDRICQRDGGPCYDQGARFALGDQTLAWVSKATMSLEGSFGLVPIESYFAE